MSTGQGRSDHFLCCLIDDHPKEAVLDLRHVVYWVSMNEGAATLVYTGMGFSPQVRLSFSDFTQIMLEHEQGRQGKNPGSKDQREAVGGGMPLQGSVGGGSPLPTPVFCSKCMYPYHTGPCHSAKGTCPECGSSLSYLTHRMGCSRSK